MCTLYFANVFVIFKKMVLFAGSEAQEFGHNNCGKMNLHHSNT
jgi:hypothetical protein